MRPPCYRSFASKSSIRAICKSDMMLIAKHKAIKYGCLAFLTIQNSALTLTISYSRNLPGPKYLSSTAVLISEILKCVVSLISVLHMRLPRTAETRPDRRLPLPLLDPAQIITSSSKVLSPIKMLDQQSRRMLMALAVPSLLYTMQNNLQFIAVSNLDAATFQVAYQGKIITTAVCAAIFLETKLSVAQACSVLLLTGGVACASIPPKSAKAPVARNHSLGIGAVGVACLVSGFAGVYTESLLKKTQQKAGDNPTRLFWLRNLQLSFISLVFAAFGVFVIDREHISLNGFLYGYNRTVWAAIILQALGGLTVAFVITHTDNILKVFATSLSVIISTLASALLWGFTLTPLFLLGMVAVLAAVQIYSLSTVPAPLDIKEHHAADVVEASVPDSNGKGKENMMATYRDIEELG